MSTDTPDWVKEDLKKLPPGMMWGDPLSLKGDELVTRVLHNLFRRRRHWRELDDGVYYLIGKAFREWNQVHSTATLVDTAFIGVTVEEVTQCLQIAIRLIAPEVDPVLQEIINDADRLVKRSEEYQWPLIPIETPNL